MAEAKQILVIDDHFEMLEFLRSMLDVSGQDYEVLAVPSAEEGLLELRRAHFDLLISDVRLPGMSGFELLRRMRKLGRDIPAIMITAYSSSQGEKEAEELGVYRYFKKPLDTDSMLTAVHHALYGEDAPIKTAVAVPNATPAAINLSDEVRKRLDMLRADTGATDLLLTTRSGQILHNIGDNQGLDMNRLAGILTRTIADSFLLADELKAKKPFTLQYHTGGHTELYCANIGNSYYLTIFFDARSRRGRIGTIWVFAQRAINDLVSMLPDLPGGMVAVPPLPQQSVVATAQTVEQVQPPAISPTRIKGDRKKREEPIPIAEPQRKEEKQAIPDWALEIPGDEPEPQETAVEPDYIDIAPDELAKLLVEGDMPADDTADLDSFWDDVLDESREEETASKGMSFEEAMQQGLISLDDNE
jgi:CheY-like chemotaxis protein